MATTTAASTSVTVPDGLVSYLRGFRILTEPLIYTPPATDITDESNYFYGFSLLVDGIYVPDYTLKRIPPNLQHWFPTYVIANQGQQITLQLVIGSNLVATFGLTFLNIYFEMYGNYLKSSGRPKELEAGNYVTPVRVIG